MCLCSHVMINTLIFKVYVESYTKINILRPRLIEKIGLDKTIHYIKGILKKEMNDKFLILFKLKVIASVESTIFVLSFHFH